MSSSTHEGEIYQRRPSNEANPQTPSMSITERWTRAILEYVWYCICCTVNGCSCFVQCWRRMRSCRPFKACINAIWNALERIFIWMFRFWEILKSILCCLPCKRRKNPLPRWRVSDSDIALSFRQKAIIQFSSLWSMTFGSVCAFLRSLSWKRVFIFINTMIVIIVSAVALIYFIFAIYFSRSGQRECKAKSCKNDATETITGVGGKTCKFGDKIGQGGFGKVFQCIGEEYVVKRVPFIMKQECIIEKTAMEIMTNEHPESSIITLVDWKEDDNYYYYFMDEVKGKTLAQLLYAFRSGRTQIDPIMNKLLQYYGEDGSVERELFVIAYLRQVYMNGIYLMNNMKWSHGDIKSDNIMVEIDEDGNLRFTVIDLGYVRNEHTYRLPWWDDVGAMGFKSTAQIDPNNEMRRDQNFAFVLDVPVVFHLAYQIWCGEKKVSKGKKWFDLYKHNHFNEFYSSDKSILSHFDSIQSDQLRKMFKDWYPAWMRQIDASDAKGWKKFANAEKLGEEMMALSASPVTGIVLGTCVFGRMQFVDLVMDGFDIIIRDSDAIGMKK